MQENTSQSEKKLLILVLYSKLSTIFNVDMTEFQSNLVPYLRIHFMLSSCFDHLSRKSLDVYTSVATIKTKRTIQFFDCRRRSCCLKKRLWRSCESTGDEEDNPEEDDENPAEDGGNSENL